MSPDSYGIHRWRFDNWLDLIVRSDAPALRSVHPGVRPLTFVALAEFIEDELATMVAHCGILPKDRLCTAMPNGPEAAVAFLGFSLFCTFAPLNPAMREADYEFEFEDLPVPGEDANLFVVVMRDEHCEPAVAVACRMGLPIIELVPNKQRGAGLFTLQWLKNPVTPQKQQGHGALASRQDIALVLHTSGTTKKPKIVPLTHENIAVGGLCIASTLKLAPGDTCVNIMPLFHIHGISINVLASLLAGASVICTPGIVAAGVSVFYNWLCDLQPRPNWYSAVPTMHQLIIQHGERLIKQGKTIEHSIELVRNCSAALVPSVSRRYARVLGCIVLPTYAMTESMPICSNPRNGNAIKLPSVGLPVGPVVRVLKDPPFDCAEMAAGMEGHIVVKGTCVTAGYEFRAHMDEDPNLAAFTPDGWLCTGDKGWFDIDGYLHLSGRFKEIINRGAEKHSPFEVEEALVNHPAVSELIAFAVPHTLLGEVVGVAIVLRPGEQATLQALRTYAMTVSDLRVELLPELAVYMKDIPKGPTGKPKRIGLAEQLGIRELTSDPACPLMLLGPSLDIPHEVLAGCTNYNAPTTAEEAALCRLWEELLSVERVGIDDDWFALGGHSLLTMRLLNALRVTQYQYVSLRDLMEVRTVRGLVARLAELLLREESQHVSQLEDIEQGKQDDELETKLDGGDPLHWLLCWFLQVAGTVVVLLSGLVALLPAFWLQDMLLKATGGGVRGVCVTVAALPAILATCPICSLLVVMLLKAVLVGKLRSGRYHMWSRQVNP